MSMYVQGYCPACGGPLWLNGKGELRCDSPGECPQPDAAAIILSAQEIEHVVTFTADGWTILHPLRERIGNALLTCQLHTHCASWPQDRLGTWRAELIQGRTGTAWTDWQWAEVEV